MDGFDAEEGAYLSAFARCVLSKQAGSGIMVMSPWGRKGSTVELGAAACERSRVISYKTRTTNNCQHSTSGTRRVSNGDVLPAGLARSAWA